MKNTIVIISLIVLRILNCQGSPIYAHDREELNYTIYFKTGFIWIAVGEMNIITETNIQHTTIHLSAKTFKKWKHIHEFDLDIKSVMDNETGLSTSYLRHSIENGMTIKDSITFDQANLNVIEVIKENDNESKRYSVPIKNQVVDILTSFHSMRLDISKDKRNQALQYMLFYNRLEYEFGFTFIKKENKKIRKLGRRDCLLMTTNAIRGRFFDQNNKLKIWMGIDESSIPYMFESPFKIGKIKIVLKNN